MKIEEVENVKCIVFWLFIILNMIELDRIFILHKLIFIKISEVLK